MEILKQVFKKSIFIILPVIVVSFFYEPQKMPLGIFFGWLLGVYNLRGLTRNVEGLIGPDKATFKIVILNIVRLLSIFAAIFILVYYKIVNIIGLLLGFTIVFSLIIIEGWKAGKRL